MKKKIRQKDFMKNGTDAMFRKLHIQMTLFSTLITGIIFLILTFICLIFAETSMRKSNYASFLAQLNSVILHLQEEDTISHQWLNQTQESGQLQIYLYDNGTPLFYQNYHQSEEQSALIDNIIETARNRYGMDIFAVTGRQLTEHTEFTFLPSSGEHDPSSEQDSDTTSYNFLSLQQGRYVSAGIIPKQNGQLSFLILSAPDNLKSQLVHLRLVILSADLAAVLLLFVFSYFFTKRMILPLERNRKKQTLFIASASHELRAPLTVLRSGFEVLKKTKAPDRQEHFLSLMSNETSRMQKLVSDMLLLANADSGNFPIHISACQPDILLLDTYEKYEPLAKKKQIALFISLPDELLPDCLCDRERITQVFSILTDNALSYTPPGGKITLSITCRKSALLFCFADTGRGIPDEEKELIFERFYRTDRSHSEKDHFGLGLGIAREIVSAHKGFIWTEDNPGGGSCFYVRLPAAR